MKLIARDWKRLEGVDLDLMKVIERGFSWFDAREVLGLPGAKLTIPPDGGVRTLERQAEIVAAGDSWTMESKHLIGEAFDFGIIAAGQVVNDLRAYEKVWLACFRPAGLALGLTLRWGGRWASRDGWHVELVR